MKIEAQDKNRADIAALRLDCAGVDADGSGSVRALRAQPVLDLDDLLAPLEPERHVA
jgi:hypothetical protein